MPHAEESIKNKRNAFLYIFHPASGQRIFATTATVAASVLAAASIPKGPYTGPT